MAWWRHESEATVNYRLLSRAAGVQQVAKNATTKKLPNEPLKSPKRTWPIFQTNQINIPNEPDQSCDQTNRNHIPHELEPHSKTHLSKKIAKQTRYICLPHKPEPSCKRTWAIFQTNPKHLPVRALEIRASYVWCLVPLFRQNIGTKTAQCLRVIEVCSTFRTIHFVSGLSSEKLGSFMFTAFVRRVDRVARSFFFIKVSFWMRWKALASKEEQPHKKKAVCCPIATLCLPSANVRHELQQWSLRSTPDRRKPRE